MFIKIDHISQICDIINENAFDFEDVVQTDDGVDIILSKYHNRKTEKEALIYCLEYSGYKCKNIKKGIHINL